jgi:hypothetical protein
MDDDSSSSSDESSIHSNILEKRKSRKTLSSYHNKWNRFQTWFATDSPAMVDDRNKIMVDTLNIIDATTYIRFFDYICLKRNATTGDLFQPTKYLSFQHVSSYKSAIKNHYSEVNYILFMCFYSYTFVMYIKYTIK